MKIKYLTHAALLISMAAFNPAVFAEIGAGGAKVSSADVAASNGVIQSLGKVLAPDSLDGFAGLDN